MRYKLIKLLDESLESYYWLGFLFGDGHFANTNRLKLTLSIKDLDHIEKFKKFLEVDNQIKCDNFKCELSIMDSYTIRILRDRYDLKSNKTYYPPDIESINGDKLKSFLIGFIDADGSIQKQPNDRLGYYITIKVHDSWFDILNYITQSTNAIIQNSGYAVVTISKNADVINLKNWAKWKCLPIMDRKWGKIDVNYISKYEISDFRKKKIKKLLKQDLSYNEIANKMKMKYSAVYNLINRNRMRG